MPNQAQHNMDNINIGGWVDKSTGINYESVNMAQGEMEARRHVRRWKCRTDTKLKIPTGGKERKERILSSFCISITPEK